MYMGPAQFPVYLCYWIQIGALGDDSIKLVCGHLLDAFFEETPPDLIN
jgi:hypothetical protein